MAKPRLQAEIVPNQDIRLYHVNFGLCAQQERFRKLLPGPIADYEQKELDKLPEHAKMLVLGIYGIPGVVGVSLEAYELRVEKARMFEWTDIEPQIVGLVKMIGQQIAGEEIEVIEKPIWEFQKWGLNADGTKRRRDSIFEDAFDDE